MRFWFRDSFLDQSFRENKTEEITKNSIQSFRRSRIPLLGPDNFKFNATPIEIETSITIISSLVQHPVSNFLFGHDSSKFLIKAGRFCQGGRQKIDNEWTTYTLSDFEECKNGTVFSAQRTCKHGVYSIKEETLKQVSIKMIQH